MNLNLVSVIIPTYGRSERLSKTIDSVVNQDYLNIEIIIVDDNNPNTDFRKETEKLMFNYINNENVIYLQHEENRNGSAARNTGFLESKGQFICFLDDDDIFFDDKISKQVKYLNDNKLVDAVYCGWIKGRNTFHPNLSGSLTKELLMMDYSPYTSSIMFRRSAIEDIEGFDESFNRHQDYEMIIRFFKKHKIGYIDEILLELGVNDGENIPKGKKMRELKEKFLGTFEEEINRISITNRNIKKQIYGIHYAAVFWSDIKNRYFIEALRVLIKGYSTSGTIFFFELNKFFEKYVRVKLKG